MVATGASALSLDTGTKPEHLTMLKTGIALLTAAWTILVIFSLLNLMPSQHEKDAPTHLEGTLVSFLLPRK